MIIFAEIADSSRLYLEKDAFFWPDCFIEPGTICIKARAAYTRSHILVIKFVWTETGFYKRKKKEKKKKKLIAPTNSKKGVGILKPEAYWD